MDMTDKINIVEKILKDRKVAIGFSGGADSTLIAYLSSKVAKDTLAITIDNHLMPKGFIENTKKICETFKINHEIIDIDFYEDENFLSNDKKRCYYCRDLMYTKIKNVAYDKGFDFICDGNNISDLVNDRPGILITYKNEFKTPFIDAKLTSKEIHQYLNQKDIPYSKSTTCLATRITENKQITHDKINKIQYCENYISDNTNCEIVKVRDFGEIGIVEVDKINEIFNNNLFKQINDALKSQGFKKVALNLSSIDDNDQIIIDYNNGSFRYQLPFAINLDNTQKLLTKNYIRTNEKIKTDNITIFESGLITGYGLKTYDDALDTFMEILPKIRRNI